MAINNWATNNEQISAPPHGFYRVKFVDKLSLEGMTIDIERLEYRMLIGNVYREIVQSPQNMTKRSTCTFKEEWDFCRCYFDYEYKFRELFLSPCPWSLMQL